MKSAEMSELFEKQNRRPCLTGGAERLSIYLVGERDRQEKIFLPVEKVLSLIRQNRLFFACERLIIHFYLRKIYKMGKYWVKIA